MPHRNRLLAAFAAVYLIWGSTYLAIQFALETLPPFLLMAVRFLVAGSVLFVWGSLRSAERPTRVHWRAAAIAGGLLILGGNGATSWAMQHVPSGVAALFSALTPCVIVILQFTFLRREVRTTAATWLGVALGFAGMVVLIGPGQLTATSVHRGGALALFLACSSWAVGTLWARRAPVPGEVRLATGMQMLCGGAALLLIGSLRGEWARVEPGTVSVSSLLALGYLVVFGSLIGYSAYTWLLRVSTPARVSTHSYVNPLVAVFLGWLVAGEVVTPRILLAAAMGLVGVALIVLPDQLRQQVPRAVPGPSPGTSGLVRAAAVEGVPEAADERPLEPGSLDIEPAVAAATPSAGRSAI